MGSIVKVHTKDGVCHQVRIRRKGFKLKYKTFKSLTKAQEWMERIDKEISSGRCDFKLINKQYTFGEVIDRYIKNVLPNKAPKCQIDQGIQLNWWKGKLGKLYISNISSSAISQCKDELLKSRLNSTVNRYLSAISHVLSVASREWELIDNNPTNRVFRLREPAGRSRFLNKDERKLLFREAKASRNPYLYTIIVIALSTGARKMEIVGLKWEDLNLDRNSITLYETKNREIRNIPLIGYAYIKMVEHYEKFKHINNTYVFESKQSGLPINIDTAWLYAIKRSGIKDFRFHDLRHSCASYLAMSGAKLMEIATILGHKDLKSTRRYSHLTDSYLNRVVGEMNYNLFKEVPDAFNQ